jgi:hypothetical protein
MGIITSIGGFLDGGVRDCYREHFSTDPEHFRLKCMLDQPKELEINRE